MPNRNRAISSKVYLDPARVEFSTLTDPPEPTVAKRALAWIADKLHLGHSHTVSIQTVNPGGEPVGPYERGAVRIELWHTDGSAHLINRDGVPLSVRGYGEGENVRLWGGEIRLELEDGSTGPLVGLEMNLAHRDAGKGDKKGITLASTREPSDIGLLFKGKRRYGNFRACVHFDRHHEYCFTVGSRDPDKSVAYMKSDGSIKSPTIDDLTERVEHLERRIAELEA